jgi:hypothetical protein
MHVLAVFSHLYGQFVDTIEDLLFGRGPCPVAGFCNGGVLIFRLD